SRHLSRAAHAQGSARDAIAPDRRDSGHSRSDSRHQNFAGQADASGISGSARTPTMSHARGQFRRAEWTRTAAMNDEYTDDLISQTIDCESGPAQWNEFASRADATPP